MVGYGMVKAEINRYAVMTIGMNDSKVNTNVQLLMNFQIKDGLSGDGIILVQLSEKIIVKNPSLLTVTLNSSIVSVDKIVTSPTLTFHQFNSTIMSLTSNTFIQCKSKTGCLLLKTLSINSSTDLGIQNVTLKIYGLNNVNYVTSV